MSEQPAHEALIVTTQAVNLLMSTVLSLLRGDRPDDSVVDAFESAAESFRAFSLKLREKPSSVEDKTPSPSEPEERQGLSDEELGRLSEMYTEGKVATALRELKAIRSELDTERRVNAYNRTLLEKSNHDHNALLIENSKLRSVEVNAVRPRAIRQETVAAWVRRAFGYRQATSIAQRGIRLLEEAVEAYQAAGGQRDMAVAMVDFVFKRPAGELGQELGGVGVCLLALAAAAGLSADGEEAREVSRVLAKPVEEFTRRNAMKNDAGFRASDCTSGDDRK